MLRLSVNRWGFTDKLFEINNLSGRRRVFTDKITFCETTINRNSSLGQSPNEEQRLGELTKASSDAGPELASSGSLVAMESPQALIAPLKRGLGGLRQGIIRCRAEAGGQGCLCGDGKPAGPDRPLERGGSGGLR